MAARANSWTSQATGQRGGHCPSGRRQPVVISIGKIVRRRCASAGRVAAAMAFARSTVPIRVRRTAPV